MAKIKLQTVDVTSEFLFFNFAVDAKAGSGVITVQIGMPVSYVRDPNLTDADSKEINKQLQEYVARKLVMK